MELETFFEQFELLADAPNGVQKLRELILQLAVQGKLVPQDPNDEAASVLLERIDAEKKRLVQEGKIKKEKKLPPLESNEAPFELPNSWEWVRFIEITSVITCGIASTPKYTTSGKIFLSAKNVKPYRFIPEEHKFVSEEDYQKITQGGKPEKDDILLTRVGAGIGEAAIIDRDFEFAYYVSLTLIKPFHRFIDSKYILHWLNSPEGISKALQNTYGKGVSQGNLNVNQVRQFNIPLPPLEEQKRIVAKVDRLMSLCDELEARQEKRHDRILQLGEVVTSQLLTPSTPEAFNQHWQGICDNFDLLYSTPENVSQLRQAILQLAVMGKLVPQDPNDEPAAVLLERIEEEKARLVKEGKIKKSEKLPPIEASEIPYDLPDSWEWLRFGEILLEITSGWSPMCEKHPKEDEEWGVLKVSAVSWDKFNPDENKALPSNLKPRPEHEVRAGDFLMSRANTSALVGKSVIVENTPERLLLSDKILRVYFSTFVDKKFFNIYNNSLAARAYYSKAASGTSDSMRNISRIQILNLPVPVPPFQEQKRIFAKINQFMSLCDELEAKLKQSINDREKLTEAAVRQVLAA